MARHPKPWYRKDRAAWFVTIDGKRHKLGADKKSAFARFHELMNQPKQARLESDLLVVIIDRFLEWTQKNRAPDTYEWYRYRLERLARRHPALRAIQLLPYHVTEWVDSYELRQTSKRNYIRSIKRCMKWATQQGYVQSNPIADMEVPGAERNEIVISDDLFERMLRLTPNPGLRDLLVVTYKSGCRPQESLRAEARHFDAVNKRWVFSQSEAKTKKAPRVVYLTDTVLEIVSRNSQEHPTGLIFRNSQGKPWTTESMNCALGLIRRRIGMEEIKRQGLTLTEDEVQAKIATLRPTKRSRGKERLKSNSELREEARDKLWTAKAKQFCVPLSLYALRHSWATHALQRGVDSLTVAILMGHSDPSTLARTYQHLTHNPTHLRDQAKRAAG